MESQPLDHLSLGLLFVLTLALQVLFIEVGLYLGHRVDRDRVKAQVSQVRSIMGAGLGLLAFMLAFTFATGQSHYETRVASMVEEARLARTAFLYAGFLTPPHNDEARAILKEYIDDRVRVDQLTKERRTAEIFAIIDKSERMQEELWEIAVVHEDQQSGSLKENSEAQAFRQAVIGLIDIHVARLEAVLMNRIPFVIWCCLYLMAALSMMVMGYQASLVNRRSPMATFTLALAFTAVMMLITDLDRPRMTLFHIDNQVMRDLQERMHEAMN